MLRSPFEQDEALQEIWLHVFRHREAVDVNQLEAFPGWLQVLARNRCIDYARRRGREQREVPDETVEAVLVDVATPYDPVEAAQTRAAVERLKAQLKNDEQRRFFELHFEKELSVVEAARALGIGEARAGYLKAAIVKRARKSRGLRQALGLDEDRRAAS